ncbi:MAG: thiamine pyrophosphate-binding protein [Candidatus Methylopumilus sp.]|jgi:acetolactate synthase-1/2/3 large subunit/sulfoacetaldehyde acetyltransferase
MKNMTGGKAVVEALRAEDVRCVFGLIGSATMEVFDALYDANDIRFIGVRDERTGTHMADGYARVSGQAGVILAGQNGPGATNLATGLAQAAAAYSPVVSIAGSLSSAHQYRDAFQEVDQQSLFKPITKKTWTVNQTARVPEMVREGFRTALTPRRGPVQLNIPRDILSESADFDDFNIPQYYRTNGTPIGDTDLISQAAALLRKASKPLIIAGGGIKQTKGAREALALAEILNAPIATSPGHGDAIPCDHPLYAGQVGPRGNIVSSKLAREADVILALGTRLGFNTTFYSYDNINRDAKIIQVEIEPTAIGRFFPAGIGIWGDARKVAVQLAAEIGRLPSGDAGSGWTNNFRLERKQLIEERECAPEALTTPIQPDDLFRVLRSVLPRDSIVTMDAGTLCLQATDKLNYFETPSLLTPLDFGLVGFSFACGLGAKAAAPERPVISLMGDGGFGMTSSELSTAVSCGLNTVTIVMNNQCWGAEKAYQRDFFGGRYIGADVLNPPYDKLAELYGARGFRVERPQDIDGAITSALECGKPAVVDIQMDPAALYSFRRDSFKHRAGK